MFLFLILKMISTKYILHANLKYIFVDNINLCIKLFLPNFSKLFPY